VPPVDQEAILKLHNELGMELVGEKDADDFADSLLETTGPPPPHLPYIRSVFGENDVLRQIRTQTFRHFDTDTASMITSPEQGAFLQLLIAALDAKQVLDVGTFTGYSSTAMALASKDVKVTTFDCTLDNKFVAEEAWRKAGVAGQINFVFGDALSEIGQLPRESFDLIFIDADKSRYTEYYEAAIALVRANGVIIIDDSLWSGRVNDDRVQDQDTLGIREVNAKIASDPRVVATLVPIHDGMTVAVKRQAVRNDSKKNSRFLAGKTISLEGNIASGKTTLLSSLVSPSALEDDLDVQAHYESPNETFLDLFYADPERYGFGFQVHMLQTCQRLLRKAKESAERGSLSLVDRSPWGNRCFADCNFRLGRLSYDEMRVYEEVYASEPLTIDLVVYLDVPPVETFQRCRQRGNTAEASIDLNYLEELDTSHFEQLLNDCQARAVPVLVLKYSPFLSTNDVADVLIQYFRGDVKSAEVCTVSRPKATTHVIQREQLLHWDDVTAASLDSAQQTVSISRIDKSDPEAYGSFKRVVLELLCKHRKIELVCD